MKIVGKNTWNHHLVQCISAQKEYDGGQLQNILLNGPARDESIYIHCVLLTYSVCSTHCLNEIAFSTQDLLTKIKSWQVKKEINHPTFHLQIVLGIPIRIKYNDSISSSLRISKGVNCLLRIFYVWIITTTISLQLKFWGLPSWCQGRLLLCSTRMQSQDCLEHWSAP